MEKLSIKVCIEETIEWLLRGIVQILGKELKYKRDHPLSKNGTRMHLKITFDTYVQLFTHFYFCNTAVYVNAF